jgi:hypothetical protein
MPLNSHRSLFVLAILATSTNVAGASGWNDYELSIDPGYTIYRCNSLDVCLGHNDGTLIYVPADYAQTGPIDAYNVTPTHIFLRTLGRSPRNLFQGDTFENVDPSRQFFFVFDKAKDSLAGPLSLAEFQTHPVVTDHGDTDWTETRNPNVARPLVGGLMFLAMSAIILGWPILLAIGVAVLIVFVLRSRRRAKAHEA